MASHAQGYAARPGFRPASLMLALGMTALPVVGLVLSLGVRHAIIEDHPFIAEPIAAPKPPPEPQPQPPAAQHNDAQPIEHAVVPQQKFDIVTPNPVIGTLEIMPQPQPSVPGTAEVGTVRAAPAPDPVLVAAMIDPRYAGAIQPPYPPAEVRAGNEGRVVLRVLIGTDGRVRQVERVSATSDAFFAAAERQALTRWRFRPATRDGVPVEQWKQLSLRFELSGRD